VPCDSVARDHSRPKFSKATSASARLFRWFSQIGRLPSWFESAAPIHLSVGLRGTVIDGANRSSPLGLVGRTAYNVWCPPSVRTIDSPSASTPTSVFKPTGLFTPCSGTALGLTRRLIPRAFLAFPNE